MKLSVSAVVVWARGQSGNPAGKPRGTRAKKYRTLENRRNPLITKMVQLALKGDRAALTWCCDRLVPALRPILYSPPAAVPDLGSKHLPLARQGRAVLRATGAGAINADTASGLLDVLIKQTQLVEATTLQERLAKLEAAVNGGQDTESPPPSPKRPREKL